MAMGPCWVTQAEHCSPFASADEILWYRALPKYHSRRPTFKHDGIVKTRLTAKALRENLPPLTPERFPCSR